MYSLVRRYIKTAVIFLVVGLAIGSWMIVQRELLLRPAMSYEVSAHTHAIFVGFVMMMILGVALWMFPRPDKNDRRYNPRLAEISYWMLTIGTAGRILSELSRPLSTSLSLRWSVVLCSLAQTAAILMFFFTMWSRIRPVGSRARESAGEKF